MVNPVFEGMPDGIIPAIGGDEFYYTPSGGTQAGPYECVERVATDQTIFQEDARVASDSRYLSIRKSVFDTMDKNGTIALNGVNYQMGDHDNLGNGLVVIQIHKQ